MKKLARLAAMLLTAVLALTMLAGCSGNFQTNPQAEEAILKYVQDNYETRDNPLTNNATLRRKAAEVLAKVNDDGTIALKDYVDATETYYDSVIQSKVTIACIIFTGTGPDENGMFQMEPYSADKIPMVITNELGYRGRWITSFGVATRVIDGKTYVAFAYVGYADGGI